MAIGRGLYIAAIIVVIVVVVALVWRAKQHGSKEGLSYPPYRNVLGYEIPIPGPGNVIGRTQPYPPARHSTGGLSDFYFPYDPASSTMFETDLCWHDLTACAGYAMEP